MLQKIIFTTQLPEQLINTPKPSVTAGNGPNSKPTVNPWVTDNDWEKMHAMNSGTNYLFCRSNIPTREFTFAERVIESKLFDCYAISEPATFGSLYERIHALILECRHGKSTIPYFLARLAELVKSYGTEDEGNVTYISVQDTVMRAEDERMYFDLSGLSPEQANFFVSSFIWGCRNLHSNIPKFIITEKLGFVRTACIIMFADMLVLDEFRNDGNTCRYLQNMIRELSEYREEENIYV